MTENESVSSATVKRLHVLKRPRVIVAFLACIGIAASVRAHAADSPQSMIATAHRLATDAGVAALKNGGNAVDAAVAAALMLGVVDGHASGIGGGCFVLIRTPDGKLIAIDGREMAPAKARRDMFLKVGKADSEASQTGPLAAAVPGALAAYDHALKHFGRHSLKDALLPAADVAERGFAIDRVYARNLKSTAATLARFDSSRQVLLKPDGSPRAEETLKQPDARTYRAVAGKASWFYGGRSPRRPEMDGSERRHPTVQDLAATRSAGAAARHHLPRLHDCQVSPPSSGASRGADLEPAGAV
jgi:gamma-glutamyltranspeptidase/glutathione hydrolase